MALHVGHLVFCCFTCPCHSHFYHLCSVFFACFCFWSFLFPTSSWFIPCLFLSIYPSVPELWSLMCFVSLSVGSTNNYRLITAYLLLRVNLDKIIHARWDFDASSARTRRASALDKHQNWSASALFCLNSRAQSKYAVVNLIHTRRKQAFLSFIMW